jgi:hypothetical protein
MRISIYPFYSYYIFNQKIFLSKYSCSTTIDVKSELPFFNSKKPSTESKSSCYNNTHL